MILDPVERRSYYLHWIFDCHRLQSCVAVRVSDSRNQSWIYQLLADTKSPMPSTARESWEASVSLPRNTLTLSPSPRTLLTGTQRAPCSRRKANPAKHLPPSSMVEQSALNRSIGVRIPGGQPTLVHTLNRILIRCRSSVLQVFQRQLYPNQPFR